MILQVILDHVQSLKTAPAAEWAAATMTLPVPHPQPPQSLQLRPLTPPAAPGTLRCWTTTAT